MKGRTFLVLVIGWLSACSLTQSAKPELKAVPIVRTVVVPAPVAPPTKTVVVDRVVMVEKKPVPCATLPAPVAVPLPTAPNAPVGKVLTDKQKIQLMQSYIWSLLDYIKASHDTAEKTYENYVNSCVTQSPAPNPG